MTKRKPRGAGRSARKRKRGEAPEVHARRVAKMDRDRERKRLKNAPPAPPPHERQFDPAAPARQQLSMNEWAARARRWQSVIRDDYEARFATAPPEFSSLIGYHGDVSSAPKRVAEMTPCPESGNDLDHNDDLSPNPPISLSQDPSASEPGRVGVQPLRGWPPLTDQVAAMSTELKLQQSNPTATPPPDEIGGIDPIESGLSTLDSALDSAPADPPPRHGSAAAHVSRGTNPPPSPALAAEMVFLTAWLTQARALDRHGALTLRFGDRERWLLGLVVAESATEVIYQRLAGVIRVAAVDLLATTADALLRQLRLKSCPVAPAPVGSHDSNQIRLRYEAVVMKEIQRATFALMEHAHGTD